MITVLVSVAGGFILGYFVGSNNPTSSVKAKIAAAAQKAASKL